MNAVEFLKLQKRICKTYENTTCGECPLCDHCLISNFDLDYDEKETVRLAEDWAEGHPLRTNGDVVKKMLEENAIWLEYTTRFSDGGVTLTFSREEWEEEYKGQYGADGCEGCKWDYLMPSDDPCCDCCHSFKSNWEYKDER